MQSGAEPIRSQDRPSVGRWRRLRTWLRRRWYFVLATLGIFGIGMSQSCSVPGPRASKGEIGALTRDRLPPRQNDGLTIPAVSFLRAGDPARPRVIYIHGTPGDSTAWADFLVEPEPGFESVAIDRPGFGKSGPDDGSGEPRQEMQARAIEPLLVQRDGRWPILVGHSLGGPIAARVAAMYPDRVSGLVIVAGSLDPAEENPGLGQRIASTSLVRAIMPRALDNAMGELSAAKDETTLLAPLLAGITCPTIVIHGDKDKLVPVSNAEYAKRMLTGTRSVRVEILHGRGHFVPWQRPDAIRSAIGELGSGDARAR